MRMSEAFGAWIRARRKAKRWVQKELAANAGVDQATVSRWELGSEVALKHAAALAAALGVSVEELARQAAGNVTFVGGDAINGVDTSSRAAIGSATHSGGVTNQRGERMGMQTRRPMLRFYVYRVPASELCRFLRRDISAMPVDAHYLDPERMRHRESEVVGLTVTRLMAPAYEDDTVLVVERTPDWGAGDMVMACLGGQFVHGRVVAGERGLVLIREDTGDEVPVGAVEVLGVVLYAMLPVSVRRVVRE